MFVSVRVPLGRMEKEVRVEGGLELVGCEAGGWEGIGCGEGRGGDGEGEVDILGDKVGNFGGCVGEVRGWFWGLGGRLLIVVTAKGERSSSMAWVLRGPLSGDWRFKFFLGPWPLAMGLIFCSSLFVERRLVSFLVVWGEWFRENSTSFWNERWAFVIAAWVERLT